MVVNEDLKLLRKCKNKKSWGGGGGPVEGGRSDVNKESKLL